MINHIVERERRNVLFGSVLIVVVGKLSKSECKSGGSWLGREKEEVRKCIAYS